MSNYIYNISTHTQIYVYIIITTNTSHDAFPGKRRPVLSLSPEKPVGKVATTEAEICVEGVSH